MDYNWLYINYIHKPPHDAAGACPACPACPGPSESMDRGDFWVTGTAVDGPAKSDQPPIWEGWNMLKAYKSWDVYHL